MTNGESLNPSLAQLGRWQLRIALTLVFLGLLFVSKKGDFQGWNMIGTIAGYVITLAILYCVYLGNKIWIWFLRIALALFLLVLINGMILIFAEGNEMANANLLTVKTFCYFIGLGYIFWTLCFAKSVRHYWRFARKF